MLLCVFAFDVTRNINLTTLHFPVKVATLNLIYRPSDNNLAMENWTNLAFVDYAFYNAATAGSNNLPSQTTTNFNIY